MSTLPEYHKHLVGHKAKWNKSENTQCVNCQKEMPNEKRTRHVFRSYDEAAHVWASQTLGYGSVYSMYFAGRSIWSYGSHFEIARFISPKEVLFTTRHYSNTTSTHKWAVRDAVKHLTVFELPSFDDMDENAKHFIDGIITLVGEIKRGRSSLLSRVASLKELQGEADTFLVRFGKHVSKENKTALKKLIKTVFFTDADLKAMEAKEARNDASQAKARITKERNDAVRDAERRAKWAAEDIARKEASRIKNESEAQVEAMAEMVEEAWESEIEMGLKKAWIAGDDRGNVPDDETLLRIKDGEIETSHHAYVPIADATRLWGMIKAGESIKDFQIGHYTVSGIHDGQLVIGCHRIPVREVARMAKMLNLMPQLEVI